VAELNSGEEVKHEPEASPPLVGPVPDEKFDDSVCQRLTMQYHLREQPSGTKGVFGLNYKVDRFKLNCLLTLILNFR